MSEKIKPIQLESSNETQLKKPELKQDIKTLSQQIEKEFGQSEEDKALIRKISQEVYQEKIAQNPQLKNLSYEDFMKKLQLDQTFHHKNFVENSEQNSEQTFEQEVDQNPEQKTFHERPANALSGSQFMQKMNQIGNLNSKKAQLEMEKQILAEIEKGNIPDFCRPENFKTITMSDGKQKVSFKAAPDYLAIGSNEDYIRVPVTPLLAQAVAEKYNLSLPTAKMTDAIFQQADLKITGGDLGLVATQADQGKMQTNEFIEKHHRRIEKKLTAQEKSAIKNGKALVAGHKKDVIISRYAIDNPGKLDFRGLYIDGKNPIQKNPAHEDTYRDYSHGFRPIGGKVTVIDQSGNQQVLEMHQALQNPQIAKILNGAEGTINSKQAYQKHQKLFA